MAGGRHLDFLRGERVGVAAAILSSAIGGIAGGTTRFAIGASDPVTLGVFRFGVGFLLLLPIALALKVKWPRGRDLRGVAALGVMYFAFFIVLFNLAFRDTTAARGSLALSTLPLLTMLVAAAFGVERLNARKSIGVIIAIAGVVVALVTDLAQAPPMAWRGDLIMVAATLVMALYNVWSRPFIVRSSPLGYVTAGMGAGSAVLALIAAGSGSYTSVADFGPSQWVAVIYLGAFGGAAAFFLWVFALERTTPTRVAITMTINPVFASAVGALALSEPIGINLAIGLVAVFIGIWIATTEPRSARVAPPECKRDIPSVRSEGTRDA